MTSNNSSRRAKRTQWIRDAAVLASRQYHGFCDAFLYIERTGAVLLAQSIAKRERRLARRRAS